MVQHDQISVHEVEPVELIAGLLGIDDVVVDDERGALGCGGGAGADLPDGAELAKEIEEGGRIDVVGKVLDEEDTVGFGGELLAGRHCGECEGGTIEPVADEYIRWSLLLVDAGRGSGKCCE